jgi:hypothetical protein
LLIWQRFLVIDLRNQGRVGLQHEDGAFAASADLTAYGNCLGD